MALAATADTSAWDVLVTRDSGKAVVVTGLSTADEAAVVQYGGWNGPDRQWQLVRIG